jgi:GntR family transcriptional repressor for pyruvate dehydrogenase complex
MMAIHKPQIHELVYEELKEMILSGKYKEGDYLPPEPELAGLLGTSRSALRGAMLLLRKMGIVEVTPGRGTIVKKVTFPSTSDPVVQEIHRHKDQVLELLEFRRGIEVEAAGLAAERATEEQIAKLKDIYSQMEEDVRTKSNGTEADLNFHLYVIEISGNKLFLQVMYPLTDLLRDTISKVRQDTLTWPEEPMVELERHKKILTAIEERDKEKARKVSSENLEAVHNKVRSWH